MKLLRSDIYENLKMALATLRTNKLRSALTVVGVVIGVWTVMAIASIISGIDLAVTKEIESFGTRSIIITKYETGIHIGRRSREERMRKELTYDDAMALRNLPAVELSRALPRHHEQFLRQQTARLGERQNLFRRQAARHTPRLRARRDRERFRRSLLLRI
jgi:ABC-type lipoprotein release transport system permease subunit